MDIKDKAVKAFEDTKDALNETMHKSAAEAERAKRDVAGDELTPGETAGSMFNEAKNETQAQIDRTKRELRND
jgi:hypothetical protein